MLLRKLTTYSHKNRLYQAFHALGSVERTIFLLRFISNVKCTTSRCNLLRIYLCRASRHSHIHLNVRQLVDVKNIEHEILPNIHL